MLKVLSRASRLAQLQVSELLGVTPHELVTLKTLGDRNHGISLLEGAPADIFTDELDAALIAGEGDVAIHSAKDLPWPLPDGLEVIALTASEDASDCLVGCRLVDLPEGARVGTSSASRKRQLLAARPDVEVFPIRGNIEQRIAQVDDGTVAAVIMATCALKRLGLTQRIAELLPFETHPLQGMLAVTARSARGDMRALFHRYDVRPRYGRVWLVGAGPGDPELLTVKAERLLHETDVIVYDNLIPDGLISRFSAEGIYVGKRKGKHSHAQAEINEILYREAVKGRTVVRLKGGDPLLFARGGEEAAYLAERMVQVETVPGISAAQAAAASANIPLTERGISRELLITSGHQAVDSKGGRTQAIYMAVSRRAEVARELMQEGAAEDTPVAAVRAVGRADESQCVTDLANLGTTELTSPAVLLVGDVVRQRFTVPRILYAGLDPSAFTGVGRVIHYPLIETVTAQAELPDGAFDGMLFTSRSAAKHYFARFGRIGSRCWCIGQRTAAELLRYGVRDPEVPPQSNSDSLADCISGGRWLYPCSNRSDNRLHKLPGVVPLIVYETRERQQRPVDLQQYQGVAFSSPSTVSSFLEIYAVVPPHLTVYVMGKFTRRRVLDAGVQPDCIVEAGTALR